MAAANAYDATYLLMYSFLGIRDGSPERQGHQGSRWRAR